MFKAADRRHARLGDAARDGRRWAEARVHYERAVAENPALDHIWVQLGHVQKELSDLRGAEAAYRRALALKPGVPDTHLQLGHLMKVAGRQEDAVKAYADAALLDPSLDDAGKELAALGYSPAGTRLFDVVFDVPQGMRRVAGAVRFEVMAALEGITAPELLQLVAHKGLRVGYRLHGGCSVSPVAHSGQAAIEVVDEATLLCRFVVPNVAFGEQPLRLLHVGLLYEGAGSSGGWDRPGAWMAIGTSQTDLASHYLALAAGRGGKTPVTA